jgi:glycosyltransferase involved in cell wall biosynthesis
MQGARTALRASVVIPTYNRCSVLARVLSALTRQSVPAEQFEVIVVADGCTDDTAEFCRRLAREVPYTLRLVEQENAGTPEARNAGVRAARAPLIIFVDDDVVPSPELVAAHLAAHGPDEDDDIVAIGPLLPPPDRRLNAWGAWEERTLSWQYADMEAGRWKPTYYQFYTGNASVARRHILDAGGFNPLFRRAEDIELGSRLDARGCTFVFLPHARAWHYVHRRFASWAAMPVAYAWAAVTMGRSGRTADFARDVSFYGQRNHAVRFVTRLCLGSAWRVASVTSILRLLAVAGWAVRLSPVSYAACSVIYNLRYYDGMAADLGSAQLFWRLAGAASAARKSANERTLIAACAEVLGGYAAQDPAEVRREAGASV